MGLQEQALAEQDPCQESLQQCGARDSHLPQHSLKGTREWG